MLYDPADEGFSPRMCAIDRCQIALLRELTMHYDARLFLKGGMAMRALYGSFRLTKDIDFERSESLSMSSLKNNLPKALVRAGLMAGLQGPVISITKSTATTFRVSLAAALKETGEPVQYEVEISGRGLPPSKNLVRLSISPPIRYRLAQFSVSSYDPHAMAASKVAALHSDQRSVPRDVFDLSDLIEQGANPVSLLIEKADVAWLKKINGTSLDRTIIMGWERANEEVLPYLPKKLRESMTPLDWEQKCLKVASTVDSWIAEAI
jgi:predicted nucleotidyltransferase component of viral defense system